MPEAKRLIAELVAGPEQVVAMSTALDAAWDQVAGRFLGASPEFRSAVRTVLAKGIINGFTLGATDPMVLKHSGLTALRVTHPEHFQTAAE